MSRGFRKVWVVMGIALIGAMIAGGREARAGVGITITGGFTPVTTDPVIEYIFNVSLAPGSAIYDGDHFSILDLPGVTSDSHASAPYQFLGDSDYLFSVSWVPMPGVPNAGSVTWAYNGLNPIINNTDTPELLTGHGQFSVVTGNTDMIPSAGSTISYSFSIDNGSDRSSPDNPPSFTLADLTAPEPSSSTIVLLIGGTAAASGLVVRARRRRTAGTA